MKVPAEATASSRQGGRRSTLGASASSVERPDCHQVISVPSPTRAARRASQRAATAQASTDGEEEIGGLAGGACAPVGSITNAKMPAVAWPSTVETTW